MPADASHAPKMREACREKKRPHALYWRSESARDITGPSAPAPFSLTSFTTETTEAPPTYRINTSNPPEVCVYIVL